MAVKRKFHKEKLLKLLSDGKWHSNSELAKVAGYRYGAVIHNLRRKDGADIEGKMVGNDPSHWVYRIPK